MVYNETDKIIIRQTEIKDFERIIAFEKNNNQFVQEYSLAEHKRVLEKECHLSIFEKGSNLLIGYIILVGVLSINKIIEFKRIVITKKGFGYGKDAVRLIKNMSFNNFGAHKIWLDVYEDNERAIKLYKTQGFKKEHIESTHDGRCLYVMSVNK